MKIGNFVYGQVRIAQGLHGSLQNNMAIDCYGSSEPLKVKAPEKGRVERRYGSGQQSGFHFMIGQLDILFHHEAHPGDTNYQNGQYLTSSSWNHLHIAAYHPASGWNPIYCYTNDDVVFTSETGQVYDVRKLPGYKDLDAATGLPIINNDMARIFYTVKFEIHTATAMYPEPKRNNPMQDLAVGTNVTQDTWAAITGENVNNNATWLQLTINGKTGWVPSAFVRYVNVPSTEQVQAENAQLKAELAKYVLDTTPHYIKTA